MYTCTSIVMCFSHAKLRRLGLDDKVTCAEPALEVALYTWSVLHVLGRLRDSTYHNLMEYILSPACQFLHATCSH